MIGELAVRAYMAMGRLASPCVGSILNWRVKRGKEERHRLQERFGIADQERPAGELIWFHAASVGETTAVIPLVGHLKSRGFQVLFTTGTVTSAALAARRLPEGAIHQYVPLDIRRYVERFLNHWQPTLAIFVESEIWPATIGCLNERKIPLALVNGRMSSRSYRGWRRSGPVGRAVMSGIAICIAQTANDARRFSNLGVRTIEVSGNLKFDVPVPAVDKDSLRRWQGRIAKRPVLVAASTHQGEEPIVGAAHRIARKSFPDLLTIIAPRHPHRGEELAQTLASEGFAVARRSSGDDIGQQTDLYLADTIGEMGLWYRLGTVIFIGGSLVPRGGQNPIEPAKLGKPILHGPHIANFRDIINGLDDSDAASEIGNTEELAGHVVTLLSDADRRGRIGERARQYVECQAGALDRTIAALSTRFDHLSGETKKDGAAT